MQSTLLFFLTSTMIFSSAHANVLPVRLFYQDQDHVKITLDESASGCTMSGILVHPVERPAVKVIWFNERLCGSNKFPVSFVSGEISAPDNVIHQGTKFNVVPMAVTIMDEYSI